MTEAQISIENLGDTTTSNLKMSEQKEEKIVLLSEAENSVVGAIGGALETLTRLTTVVYHRVQHDVESGVVGVKF